MASRRLVQVIHLSVDTQKNGLRRCYAVAFDTRNRCEENYFSLVSSIIIGYGVLKSLRSDQIPQTTILLLEYFLYDPLKYSFGFGSLGLTGYSTVPQEVPLS